MLLLNPEAPIPLYMHIKALVLPENWSKQASALIQAFRHGSVRIIVVKAIYLEAQKEMLPLQLARTSWLATG